MVFTFFGAIASVNLSMSTSRSHTVTRFPVPTGKYPGLFDAVLANAGIEVVLTGVRMPRMNAITERWVLACRREFLDRALIWNQRHLLRALREFETFYNHHRPHQGIGNARPCTPLPPPITDHIARLDVRRHQRLGGILNECEHAA